jgi:uncharacterized protein HemX
MEQVFQILETAARSEHAALLIALAAAFVLGWAWWKSEIAHNERYNSLLDTIREQEEEITTLAKEALGTLQDVASALAGMERTLDGVDALIHAVLNNRLHGGKDES